MPDYEVIRTHAVAAAPEFYTHVARAFAFLTDAYGYRLASQEITAIDDVRDTQVVVKYLTLPRLKAGDSQTSGLMR